MFACVCVRDWACAILFGGSLKFAHNATYCGVRISPHLIGRAAKESADRRAADRMDRFADGIYKTRGDGFLARVEVSCLD